MSRRAWLGCGAVPETSLEQVPDELRGLVVREGQALLICEDLEPRFRSAEPLLGVGLWVGVAGLLWAATVMLAAALGWMLGFADVALLLTLAPPLWFGGSLMALVLLGVGLRLHRPRRFLRIEPGDATDQLVLEGEPGCDLVLRFDHGRTIAFPQVRERKLTVHAIRWIARQVALHTGAELEDRIDDATWEAWTHDAELRRLLSFRMERHGNQSRFAKRMRITPAKPRDIEFELGGMRWQQLHIEDGCIHTNGRSLPLRSLRDGYVRSVLHTIELRLLTEDGPISVAPDVYSAQAFSHYRWIVGLLLDESRKLRALDRGTEEDVPDTLRRALQEHPQTDEPNSASGRVMPDPPEANP